MLNYSISSIISWVLNISLPRLFPGSLPYLKLIIPQGYIHGNTVSVLVKHTEMFYLI